MTKSLHHDAAIREKPCFEHKQSRPVPSERHGFQNGLPLRQTGQSSMEYAVVCAALAFAIGIGMKDEHSVLQELLHAYRTAYAKVSFSMSLPQ